MQGIAIPPLPTVVAQVIRFDANDPKNGAPELEKLILPDRAISADLLRVSNSAYYGRSGKVKLLKDALAVLGVKATKNLVIYLSTRTMTSKYKSETFRKYLNHFPIFAALTAQNVASATTLKMQAEEGFLAALLHSIGMNLMALQHEGHYSDMLAACEKNKWDLAKLEKQSYGVTHIELGRQAAQKWALPPIYEKLMGVSPVMEAGMLAEPLEKLTFIAAVVAATLLEIPYPENNRAAAQQLYAELGGKGDLFAQFASPEALQRLQSHPFAQLAMA
jgi:HD-like signal output (HDOD) protein